MTSPPLLEADRLVKYFRNTAAINNVSFRVDPGEILGLIGPNGSGKTTIFNLITNRVNLTSGSIHFKGRNIARIPAHRIRHLGIGRTFQRTRVIKSMTVEENVSAAVVSFMRNRKRARELAVASLELCDLCSKKDLPAGRLPLGEQKRLEIARTIAIRPELLLLDETASGLNASELGRITELIMRIRSRGTAVIAVEHIMKFIMSISDTLHVIHSGKTLARGTPRDVARHPAVIEAYLGDECAQD